MDEIKQKARELLAAEYDRDNDPELADGIRNAPELGWAEARAVRAIEQALTQQRGPSVADDMRAFGVGYMLDGQRVDPSRITIITTPQPSADAVRELVKRWRECAKSAANGPMFDGASEYAVAGTYIDCADELESLLSAASGEKGVG